MKKVLIWNTYELKPTGGPSGYLYNIRQHAIHNKIENIVFLSDIIDIKDLKESRYDYFIFKVVKKIWGLFKKNNSLNVLLFIKIISSKKQYQKINIELNCFDYIHFHTSYEFTKYIDFLKEKDFSGKTILTTHTPKPTYLEIIEDWNHLKVSDIPEKTLNLLKKVDFFAFDKADILLFPDRFALEPYKTWNDFNKIETKKNFQFIPTGINPVNFKEKKDSILKKYNIPNESFIISYVGRHNETKGFDLLKKFGEILLDKYKNLYFLIAGKEEPLQGLAHDRWIEVGWTNDPFSIINACDIFALPNKETYFDLILLEVMGLDKPVLLSSTGGNKYFIDKGLDLYYFEGSNLQSMINTFESEIYGKHITNNINKNYICNNLQTSHYVKKYLELLNNG